MRFARFVIGRTVTFVFVVWIGVTAVFFVPRLLPGNPVDAMLGRLNTQGAFMDPSAVKAMRSSLADLFGTKGSLVHQYTHFLDRVFVTHDFGPSLADYPTPVSTLIGQALPWTLGLLLTSTILAWVIGNAIGLVAGYRRDRTSSKLLEGVSMFLYPIPYYILALILIILFTVVFQIFPISTAMTGSGWTAGHLWSIVYNSLLPALSIVLVGIGWWVLSTKALASDLTEEDFVQFARLKGLSDRRIMTRYVLPNALLPQITVLALQLGGVLGGALITEVVFNYPGLGRLIYNAILQSDYNLMMGAISLVVVAVALAGFVIDLLYPLLDPRIRLR
jgi:peptide/nickel transport system permease protein